MSNKQIKIRKRAGREDKEIKQTWQMFDKAEELLEKYKSSENIPPEELDPLKTGIDDRILLALCELIEDVLATKGVPIIGKKADTGWPRKEKTMENEGRRVGLNFGTNEKKTDLKNQEGMSRKKKIKVVPMHIIAAMVFGDPKYNN